MAKAADKKQSDPELDGLKVKSVNESFWRARRKFTREEVTIPLVELDETAIDLIENEPLLVSTRVKVKTETAAAI